MIILLDDVYVRVVKFARDKLSLNLRSRARRVDDILESGHGKEEHGIKKKTEKGGTQW
jgi:hypothetical protein